MKRIAVVFLICLNALLTQAFHIVGGEIEFVYIGDGIYRINVIQYFDEAQEDNPGPEGAVEVSFFRSSDDVFLFSQILSFETIEDVNYTNPECTIDELATSRVVWTAELLLDPFEFDDPKGYYIVWERCCRNDDIKNIVNPDATGMTYVLDFPPLVRNGERFINSSPVLFQPLLVC